MKDSQNLTNEMLELASNEMILSASGWRGLFNIEKSEESSEKCLDPSYEILTVIATKVFLSFLKSNYPNTKKIILARDGRPTGENIEKIAFFTLQDDKNDFENGILNDEESLKFLETHLKNFNNWIEKIK